MNNKLSSTLAIVPLVATLAHGNLTVDPGIIKAPVGAATAVVPIPVTGGDAVTDMAGTVEVGNPPAAGPTITGVDFTGSIWEAAPGGYLGFGSPPPAGPTVEPQVVLLAGGQTVAGNGTLMTLTVDISGRPAGDYPIRLSGTLAGTTQFQNGGTAVPATFITGILRLVDGLEGWRLLNFPGDAPDPAKEAAIWGDLADPDGDGLTNIEEYYLGSNPKVPTGPAGPTTPGRPVASLVDDGGTLYPAVSFTRRKAPDTVTATVQTAPDIASWTTAGITQYGSAVNLPGGDFEYVTFRFATAVGGEPARTFRLLVENAAP